MTEWYGNNPSSLNCYARIGLFDSGEAIPIS